MSCHSYCALNSLLIGGKRLLFWVSFMRCLQVVVKLCKISWIRIFFVYHNYVVRWIEYRFSLSS